MAAVEGSSEMRTKEFPLSVSVLMSSSNGVEGAEDRLQLRTEWERLKEVVTEYGLQFLEI